MLVSVHFKPMAEVRMLKWKMRGVKALMSMSGDRTYPPSLMILDF